MDYLVYAHLQLAEDREARSVVDEMLAVKGYNPNLRTGPYAVAASQARYMVERNDWNGAAALRPEESRFAYVDAITRFARRFGRGALRQSDRGSGRHREARRAARQAPAGQRPVLGGAGGNSGADRQCLGAAGRGQARRGARAR